MEQQACHRPRDGNRIIVTPANANRVGFILRHQSSNTLCDDVPWSGPFLVSYTSGGQESIPGCHAIYLRQPFPAGPTSSFPSQSLRSPGYLSSRDTGSRAFNLRKSKQSWLSRAVLERTIDDFEDTLGCHFSRRPIFDPLKRIWRQPSVLQDAPKIHCAGSDLPVPGHKPVARRWVSRLST